MPDVIGLFLRSADNAYQRQLKEVGLREAQRHGFTLQVQTAQFDSSQQVAQIRDAISAALASKLIALLVSGVRDTELRPLAHQAAEAGLEWALLNEGMFIDEVREQHPGRAIFAVTCDQASIGRVQADQVRAVLRQSGRVLCVTGNKQNVAAQLRLEGLKQGLGSDFDELSEVNADWTSEGARRAVEKWADTIANERDLPKAFVAQNDEMALGVRQALRDLDSLRRWPLAGAPIFGCDGSESFGQRLVREGRLKATVIMPPGSAVAIEHIARVRKGGDIPPVRVLLPVVSFPSLSQLKR